MSNVGRWEPWYSKMTADDAGRMYGIDAGRVFEVAADWLEGLAVEDWGCGFGSFRAYHSGPYVGVDGTAGFCDVVDDLETRRSSTPGLMMRAVLEHNTGWQTILANAVASAQERIVVAVFTPDGEGEQIDWCDELGVPDLAIPHAAIDAALADWSIVKTASLVTTTAYGREVLWLGQR